MTENEITNALIFGSELKLTTGAYDSPLPPPNPTKQLFKFIEGVK